MEQKAVRNITVFVSCYDMNRRAHKQVFLYSNRCAHAKIIDQSCALLGSRY